MPAQEGDRSAIKAVLAEAELPGDVEGHRDDFLVARHGKKVVGCVGLEVRGSDALFRSLAVAPAYRGLGLGRKLYAALEELAKRKGFKRAYLLTTTIESLAESWGFRRVDRAQVPAAIQETWEFRGDHCASAVPMWKDLSLPNRSAPCCG